MAYLLSCLICSTTPGDLRAAGLGDGTSDLVLMQEHVMREHGAALLQVQRTTKSQGQTDDGRAVYTYYLPAAGTEPARPWLRAEVAPAPL